MIQHFNYITYNIGCLIYFTGLMIFIGFVFNIALTYMKIILFPFIPYGKKGKGKWRHINIEYGKEEDNRAL